MERQGYLYNDATLDIKEGYLTFIFSRELEYVGYRTYVSIYVSEDNDGIYKIEVVGSGRGMKKLNWESSKVSKKKRLTSFNSNTLMEAIKVANQFADKIMSESSRTRKDVKFESVEDYLDVEDYFSRSFLKVMSKHRFGLVDDTGSPKDESFDMLAKFTTGKMHIYIGIINGVIVEVWYGKVDEYDFYSKYKDKWDGIYSNKLRSNDAGLLLRDYDIAMYGMIFDSHSLNESLSPYLQYFKKHGIEPTGSTVFINQQRTKITDDSTDYLYNVLKHRRIDNLIYIREGEEGNLHVYYQERPGSNELSNRTLYSSINRNSINTLIEEYFFRYDQVGPQGSYESTSNSPYTEHLEGEKLRMWENSR